MEDEVATILELVRKCSLKQLEEELRAMDKMEKTGDSFDSDIRFLKCFFERVSKRT